MLTGTCSIAFLDDDKKSNDEEETSDDEKVPVRRLKSLPPGRSTLQSLQQFTRSISSINELLVGHQLVKAKVMHGIFCNYRLLISFLECLHEIPAQQTLYRGGLQTQGRDAVA